MNTVLTVVLSAVSKKWQSSWNRKLYNLFDLIIYEYDCGLYTCHTIGFITRRWWLRWIQWIRIVRYFSTSSNTICTCFKWCVQKSYTQKFCSQSTELDRNFAETSEQLSCAKFRVRKPDVVRYSCTALPWQIHHSHSDDAKENLRII